MKLLRSRALWGILLVLGGLALLLENLNVLKIEGLVWAVILALAGLVFLSEYMTNASHWWPLIPGISLLAIALTIFLDYIFPSLSRYIGGFIILAGIGLSFLLVYLKDRTNWWAVIPAGVMVTLGVVSIIDNADLGFDSGGFFLIGIGLTFFLVALLPGPHEPMKWAYIPGTILLILGAVVLGASGKFFNYIWPALLILGGGFLAVRALLSDRGK